MKKTLLFTLFIRLTLSSFSQNAVEVKQGPVRMHVHNVCYNAGLVVVCNGSDSLGIHPSMGITSGFGNPYIHSDSLLLFDRIKYFDIDNTFTSRIVLGDSNMLMSYYINYSGHFFAIDTLFTDSIGGACISNNKIFVIKNDSLLVFDTLSNNYLQAYALNFSPRFVAAFDFNVGVVGVNANGQSRLLVMNYLTANVDLDTTFGTMFDNPVGISLDYYSTSFISAPGDTALNHFSHVMFNHTSSYSHCYSGSGPHCLSMRSGLYFQPESDTGIYAFDSSLFTGCGFSYLIGRLKAICPPVTDTYYPYFSIIHDTPNNHSFVELDAVNYMIMDTIPTGLNPMFIVNDYRCPIKVSEYDDSKVEWKIFPNPSTANTTIDASGLICGRDNKLDITDMNGRVLYETIIHSKTSYDLPVDKFPKGVYFVRIHSLKGLITQKLVKL